MVVIYLASKQLSQGTRGQKSRKNVLVNSCSILIAAAPEYEIMGAATVDTEQRAKKLPMNKKLRDLGICSAPGFSYFEVLLHEILLLARYYEPEVMQNGLTMLPNEGGHKASDKTDSKPY